jgi:hypothetical protein
LDWLKQRRCERFPEFKQFEINVIIQLLYNINFFSVNIYFSLIRNLLAQHYKIKIIDKQNDK